MHFYITLILYSSDRDDTRVKIVLTRIFIRVSSLRLVVVFFEKGINMWKERMRFLRDALIKHSKVAFPVIVIVAVAATVALALGAGRVEEQMEQLVQDTMEKPETIVSSVPEETTLDRVIPEVPLEDMSYGAMYTLMATYYNALANGDVATIRSISNYVEDTEIIRIQELSKYIESYPLIEIYTKPGPVENSYVAYVYTHVTFYGHEDILPGLTAFYVCTDENGNLYLNEGENPDDVLDYITTVSLQDDVVELNNKVNAEYNDLILSNEKLFEYLSELEKEVSKATGEALAAQYANAEQDETWGAEGSDTDEEEAAGESTVEVPAEQGTVYATATTTVNVRSSDSEQADKLGKVAGGTRVQVSEQRANGWTKVIFEGKDGYIKSEYLQVEGTGSGGEAVKTVKATTNVNLRREASETADKIGVVVGGDSLEVLSEANGWTQVRYKGMVGFVKSDYVQ